jgi:hypothetical protein
MKPKTFNPKDRQAIYTLLYADGETADEVVGVHIEDETIVVEYPFSHGSGLKVGRIERETVDSIEFRVAEPQLPHLLDGVVKLTDTGRRWE